VGIIVYEFLNDFLLLKYLLYNVLYMLLFFMRLFCSIFIIAVEKTFLLSRLFVMSGSCVGSFNWNVFDKRLLAPHWCNNSSASISKSDM
jgi:hypothetical protein